MIAALAAAALLAPATGGPVDDRAALQDPQPEVTYHERAMDWALAGVSRDGRTLVVQPGWWGGCDKGPPKVRVIENASEIVVEAAVLEPDGIEAMLCPAIARSSDPQRIALDAPIAGRRVLGPKRVRTPGSAMPQIPEAEPVMPRVTGLRATDARAVLCGWLVRARGATGNAVVARQSVAPGTVLRAPAGAAPERCADLPARPVVRLRAAR